MAAPIATFEEHIKPMFADYQAVMLKHGIDLLDYSTVKSRHERMTVLMHGHERNENGEYISARRMPTTHPFPQRKLDLWDKWIADGMVEGEPVAEMPADTVVTFDDIKLVFEDYRDSMLEVKIATPTGLVPLDLWDYDLVKSQNEHISSVLHGRETDANNVPRSSHPMPPANALAPQNLKKWDNWVAGGMIKSIGQAV